jgi:hypothetical protein
MTVDPIRDMLLGLRERAFSMGVPYGHIGILRVYVETAAGNAGIDMVDVEAWMDDHEAIRGRDETSITTLRSGGGVTYQPSDAFYHIPRVSLGL